MNYKIIFIVIILFLASTTYAQNVGIGTTNPSGKLHIDGANTINEVLRLEAESSPFMSFYQSGVYKAFVGINNNGLDPIDFRIATTNGSNYPIKFFTNNNERMHIAANGNIGIGSPAIPLTPLHINSNTAEALRLQGPTSYMTFYDNNNYRGYIQASSSAIAIGSTGTNSINFYTAGGSQRATILDNGKVGIGNTFPNAQLDINSDDAEVIKINSSTSPYIGFYNNNSYQGFVWGDEGLKIGTASSPGKTLRMFTNGQERMSLMENGNVGINNNNPLANLHINASSGEAIRVQAPSAFMSFYDNTNYTGYLQSSGNVMSLAAYGVNRLSLVTSFTERLTITPNGNIGINKTTANTALDVNGYTRLGSEADAAPKIKTKKITGTTPTDDDLVALIPAGIDCSKILSVSIFVTTLGGGARRIPPKYQGFPGNTNYEYYIDLTTNSFIILPIRGQSSGILSSPISIFITYEE